jgi:hypothetical protein
MKKKPVFEITLEEKDNYEYCVVQNVARTLENKQVVLASDSLINLKKEIKNRGWKFVYLEMKDGGLFAVEQNLVNECVYRPRYNCHFLFK